jgi:legumain
LQANAYQLLVNKGGYLEEQVILLSANDVYDDPENGIPNTLFNRPDPNATDVYVKPTYQGSDVNADVVLGVLSGNTTATNGGPVLKSDEDSEVFIAYFDHGAPGLVGMPYPDSKGDFYLYADRLNRTLNYMLKHKMARSIAIYVEACESGSMFADVLHNNKSIYAVTAANPDQSSWGWYIFGLACKGLCCIWLAGCITFPFAS